MKAAAGIYFGTYTGYADACRKLKLGDLVQATPHIVIYYTKKIASSTVLHEAGRRVCALFRLFRLRA